MSELIIYKGSKEVAAPSQITNCYLYRIGSGRVIGNELIELNDKVNLNKIAEELRDDYSQWIYSLNNTFRSCNLIHPNLSLFFLTDLSCKRSEFFETYDNICNLYLIRNALKDIEINKAWLIGVDKGFVRAFRSIFTNTEIMVSEICSPKVNQWRRVGADLLFLFRLVGAIAVNLLDQREKVPNESPSGRYFYSVYPQMFSDDGIDTKFGLFVGSPDRYAVSILTDGMHQSVSISRYIQYRREVKDSGMILIDGFLGFRDVCAGVYWLLKTRWIIFRNIGKSYFFNEMDVTEMIRVELLYSFSRLVRLLTVMGAFRRFFYATPMTEFVYYPVEYSFGRMVSYVANAVNKRILRRGFQMGPVSWRRMEQFLAPNEASQYGPFLNHAPIPDSVLVEDEESANIFRYSGYKNVEVMNEIYRYGYLNSIQSERREGWVLVVNGLHDGALMMELVKKEIIDSPKKTYVLKRHPRADNAYLEMYKCIPNIIISNQPIQQLLGIVSEVFVTYSSVGIEAKLLGLPVTVIDIPGKINTSPLISRSHQSGHETVPPTEDNVRGYPPSLQ